MRWLRRLRELVQCKVPGKVPDTVSTPCQLLFGGGGHGPGRWGEEGTQWQRGYEHIAHNILLYCSPVFEELKSNDFCLHSAPDLL